jgi:hypothetical protein
LMPQYVEFFQQLPTNQRHTVFLLRYQLQFFLNS